MFSLWGLLPSHYLSPRPPQPSSCLLASKLPFAFCSETQTSHFQEFPLPFFLIPCLKQALAQRQSLVSPVTVSGVGAQKDRLLRSLRERNHHHLYCYLHTAVLPQWKVSTLWTRSLLPSLPLPWYLGQCLVHRKQSINAISLDGAEEGLVEPF
jgi:hypothetical protein